MKDLIPRIKALILQPAATWPEIEADPDDHMTLLKKLVLPLAAIPAIGGFIGTSVVGIMGFRVPFGSGLTSALVQYVLSIVAVFVVAFLVDALAPKFGAEKNFRQSFKLVAWSMVPGYLAGVFYIIPALGVLGIVAGLYGLYLLYLGLPVMKKNPGEKTVPYLVVTIVSWIVLAIVTGALAAAARPSQTDLAEAQAREAAQKASEAFQRMFDDAGNR